MVLIFSLSYLKRTKNVGKMTPAPQLLLDQSPVRSKPFLFSPNPIFTSFPLPSAAISFSADRSTFRALAMAQNSVIEPQKVIVSNSHGEKLAGLLHDTGSKKVVVLCHGFFANKGQKTLVNLSLALEKEGISAFRFDFAGNGESEGSFQYGNYMREVEDLFAVVKHLSGLNRSVTAILGHSKGGNVVLLYASKYHNIPTVINLSGRYKLDGGVKERLGQNFMERIKMDGYIDVKNKAGEFLYRVTEESLMDRLNTDMHEACLRIDRNCRVLTVHGSTDDIVPVEDSYEFSKIIPNHKLQIIEKANHGYTSHQTELVSVVLDFIKMSVGNIETSS